MTDGAGENTKTQDSRPRGKPIQVKKKKKLCQEGERKKVETITCFFLFVYVYEGYNVSLVRIQTMHVCLPECVSVCACASARYGLFKGA